MQLSRIATTKLPRIYKPLKAYPSRTISKAIPIRTMTTLFPRYPSNTGFDTLLRLLDTSDAPTRHSHHAHPRTFTPKFDVKEEPNAYELHGELPGIKQEDIDIEWIDASTLVIKGRTEREVVRSSDDTDDHHEADKSAKAIHDKPHKATVEDDTDEQNKNKTEVAKSGKGEDGTVETRREETPQYRYWVSERSVGEFQRSFSFPGKVDQDAVKASLKNGILSVVVPKLAKKPHSSKKVTIE